MIFIILLIFQYLSDLVSFNTNNIYSIIYIILIYNLATNWQQCRQHILFTIMYVKTKYIISLSHTSIILSRKESFVNTLFGYLLFIVYMCQ